MEVTVEFWGAAQRAANAKTRQLTLEPGSTIASLASALADSDDMRALLRRCAFSVGCELVPRTHALKQGDEVAVLPPVNGG